MVALAIATMGIVSMLTQRPQTSEMPATCAVAITATDGSTSVCVKRNGDVVLRPGTDITAVARQFWKQIEEVGRLTGQERCVPAFFTFPGREIDVQTFRVTAREDVNELRDALAVPRGGTVSMGGINMFAAMQALAEAAVDLDDRVSALERVR